MPGGTSWPRYLTAVGAAMLSMFAGAQTVHIVYQPLQELSDRVATEKNKLKLQLAETTSLSASGSQTSTDSSGGS